MSGAPSVLDLRGADPQAPGIGPAVDHLRAGGVLAYPTETVYGFGARCTPEGVDAVRLLKGRSDAKPFLALVACAEDVGALAWTEEARELAGIFWPGALTLVLADPGGLFPDGVRTPAGTVAVRVSPHALVRTILEGLGEPLISTSANRPGGPPARSGAEVLEVAAALNAGPELLVVEAGTLPSSSPSTIVDCTGDRARVVREGTIPVNRLRCALPDVHGR